MKRKTLILAVPIALLLSGSAVAYNQLSKPDKPAKQPLKSVTSEAKEPVKTTATAEAPAQEQTATTYVAPPPVQTTPAPAPTPPPSKYPYAVLQNSETGAWLVTDKTALMNLAGVKPEDQPYMARCVSPWRFTEDNSKRIGDFSANKVQPDITQQIVKINEYAYGKYDSWQRACAVLDERGWF